MGFVAVPYEVASGWESSAVRRYQGLTQAQNEPGHAISTKFFLLEPLRVCYSGVGFTQ
jgi:hypothetical protein